MATHTTEVVSYQKLSNGQAAVVIRCCGNASTDFPHTFSFTGDAAQRAQNLQSAHGQCAQQHQAQIDSDAGLPALMEPETHNL